MAEWPACGGSGGVSGCIQVPFDFSQAAFDSTTTIPAGALCSVADVDVTTDFSPGASVLVGTAGIPNLFADSTNSDLDPEVIDLYHIPQRTAVAAEDVVRVTVGGDPDQGAGFAVVYWWIPEA